jgi:hypothetical protein
MEITIEGVQLRDGSFEVHARFTEGSQSIVKVNQFSGATKFQVEQWLQNEAERMCQSMKTVDELQAPELEKAYVYEPGRSVMTKTAFEAVKAEEVILTEKE